MSKDPQTESAELQAALQNQQAIAAARTSVAQLEDAIQHQQAQAQRLQEEADALAVPQAQREDLLADIATGQDKAAELAALDKRLEQHKSAVAAAQGERAAIAQTVAGLTRRLERSQGELTALQEVRPKLIRALLRERAETLGAAYVLAAQQLSSLYLQINGLGTALLNHGATQHIRSHASLKIPAFSLESVQPYAMQLRSELIVSGIETHGESLALARQEEERLRALGVELG